MGNVHRKGSDRQSGNDTWRRVFRLPWDERTRLELKVCALFRKEVVHRIGDFFSENQESGRKNDGNGTLTKTE